MIDGVETRLVHIDFNRWALERLVDGEWTLSRIIDGTEALKIYRLLK